MNPYYQDDAVTIYHGDCRDILPLLPKVDLVLTDPPYNCGKDYGEYKDNLSDADYENFMAQTVGVCLDLAVSQAWVAPRYQLGLWLRLLPTAHLVVIRRGAAGPFRAGWSDQFEVLLTVGKPNRCVPDLWDDIRLKGEGYFFREETYGHPGYTPEPIMRRCVTLLSKPGNLVLDPFCGTGTSLRAAKDLGRKVIGIEIEEKYAEIAARRMQQSVLPLECENQGRVLERLGGKELSSGSSSMLDLR